MSSLINKGLGYLHMCSQVELMINYVEGDLTAEICADTDLSQCVCHLKAIPRLCFL